MVAALVLPSVPPVSGTLTVVSTPPTDTLSVNGSAARRVKRASPLPPTLRPAKPRPDPVPFSDLPRAATVDEPDRRTRSLPEEKVGGGEPPRDDFNPPEPRKTGAGAPVECGVSLPHLPQKAPSTGAPQVPQCANRGISGAIDGGGGASGVIDEKLDFNDGVLVLTPPCSPSSLREGESSGRWWILDLRPLVTPVVGAPTTVPQAPQNPAPEGTCAPQLPQKFTASSPRSSGRTKREEPYLILLIERGFKSRNCSNAIDGERRRIRLLRSVH